MSGDYDDYAVLRDQWDDLRGMVKALAGNAHVEHQRMLHADGSENEFSREALTFARAFDSVTRLMDEARGVSDDDEDTKGRDYDYD